MQGGNQRYRLPADVNSFVGRAEDVRDVKRLLSAARLVTLVGMGGTGKSRLAMRVAHQVRRAFRDGVWLLELAPVRNPDMAVYALADVFGISQRACPSMLDVVADHLHERHCLLLVDSCEHLLDASAEIVDTLLRGVPDLRVLCTSRQRLATAGEHVYQVEPLPVPDPTRPAEHDELTRYPSVALFLQRAGAAAPDLAVAAQDALVTRICHRLDGLPLAIELAAARVGALTLEQLSAGLDDRFHVLRTRGTPAPGAERHRTLQATFDWSFELCSPAERALWTRACVFSDSFELDAVTSVCASADLPAGSMLDVVADLVEKSILCRTPDADTVRYRLLETVRDYGAARLAGGDAARAALLRRHRDWYLALTDRFHADWFGPNQVEWLRRLRAEYPNVRAALGHCLTDPDSASDAQRMAGNLVYYWWPGGGLHEGRYWLRRAREADRRPSAARARALSASAATMLMMGDLHRGRALAQEGLDVGGELGDPAVLARARVDFGALAVFDGDLRTARPLLQATVDELRQRGQVDLTRVMGASALALALLLDGEAGRAREVWAECDDICRQQGDRWWRCHIAAGASGAALATGDPAEAARLAQQGLRLAAALGETSVVADLMERLGWIAAADGECERAALLLGAAAPIWASVGRAVFGSSPLLRERTEAIARCVQALGDSNYRSALIRGGQLSLQEAVAYALQEGGTQAVAAAEAPADPLTRRERQVAELIGKGLSNKAIAAEMVVSSRTVESHVENILRKLGFTSRVQVVRWLADPST